MNERDIWLDYLRASACMLVVMLHTSAPYLNKINSIPIFSWSVGNYVDSFTRISIPLFFMISGYLFFGDRRPHFRHYLRIILAVLFYSSIAVLYLKFYREISIWPSIKKIILFKPVFYHLWFFYSILAIYILAGFLTTRRIGLRSIIILSTLCFIVLNPRLSHILKFFGISFSGGIHLDGNVIYYTLYATWGAILGRMQIKNGGVVTWLAPFLYVFSSLLIAHATFISSTKAGKYVGTFYSYNGIFVFIGAISVFLFIKENEGKFYLINKPASLIARNSLAIYGVHAFILDFFYRQEYRNYDSPILDIIIVFLVTLLLSLLIATFIKRFDRYGWVS
jgi:surface polysaccharide O-acyltransferase-like enzyme